MSQLVVSVFGPDRPGIIAEVTAALAGTGGNLEDCTMTILRGRLAMMLVVSTPASADDVTDALTPVRDGGLQISVREVPPEPEAPPGASSAFVLTVHGGDRPGIVSAVTGAVAGAGGNITDLTTRLSGDLYVAVAEVELAASADVPALQRRLDELRTGLGVEVGLRPADSDEL